jgi:hypothetical protein
LSLDSIWRWNNSGAFFIYVVSGALSGMSKLIQRNRWRQSRDPNCTFFKALCNLPHTCLMSLKDHFGMVWAIRKPMKHIQSLTILALASSFPLAGLAQTTIFNDSFNAGSTLNTANTAPTATSTGYQIASTKSTSGSLLNPGDLKLNFASTSSGIAEIQALFTTSPISLSAVGDSITLNVTFAATSGILVGSSSFIAGGLYNSGGIAPISGGNLANGGTSSNLVTYASGGAQNWLGYVGRINGTGNSLIATRPAQTAAGGLNNTVQDLIGNSFSASGGYNNPAGASLHSKSSTAGALATTDSFQYTLSYTLGATGLTIADSLTDLTTTASLFSDSTTASGANEIATTFDGFAFGDRAATAGAANTVDISNINITSNVQPVPEPTSIALLSGGAILGLLMRRKRS